ncbi:nucleotide exchange factor GrpE [Streptosporangium sp. NPDC023615]|uniref:nucleotide exchange factor GrpE n=1 Tax=Streptosporangium sp. NPDC023615 TaxID=3154794 RepID=UPI00343E89C1
MRDRGVFPGSGLGTVETPMGVLPLPSLLAGAVAVLAAVAAGLYLWHRNRAAPAPRPFPGATGAPFSAPVPGAGPFPGPVPGPFPETPPGPPLPGALPTPAPSGARPTPPFPETPAEPPGPPGPPGPPDDRTTAPTVAPITDAVTDAAASPGTDAAADPLTVALAEVAGSGISPALAQQVERLLAEGHPGREALVTACIGYRDQLAERHPRLAGTLLDGLNRAGVREIVADGQRFDPRLHEASGTEPAPRPDLHDLVAETVRQGYADGERVVRVPRVTVYRDVRHDVHHDLHGDVHRDGSAGAGAER